jgi:hypothetical protein
LILTVFGAFAEFERARISERTREAMAVLRQQGAVMGRFAPYGFLIRGKGASGRRLVPCPEERALTRQCIAWCLEGWSHNSILIHLWKNGIKTKHGSDWSAGVLARALAAELRLQQQEVLGKGDKHAAGPDGPTPPDPDGPEPGGSPPPV